jgi:hypothetical protein
MKKLIVASAFAALVGFGMSSAAEAKTNFQLYLGYPHYDYRPGDDYLVTDMAGTTRDTEFAHNTESASVATKPAAKFAAWGSGMFPPLSAMAGHIPSVRCDMATV